MNSKRSQYDFYATPPDVVSNMLDQFDFTHINSFCEPAAGDGAIALELRKRYPDKKLWLNEIDTSHAEKLTVVPGGVNNTFTWRNFLDIEPILLQGTQIYISNPPFSIAQEFLEHLLSNIRLEEQGVIMLLRLGFLGSQKRHEFWQKYPPCKILAISKRPSFTGNGTDSQEYAWFCWGYRAELAAKNPNPICVI